MSTVNYETTEMIFYDSEESLASETAEDLFRSANEEFFLPYDVRTDVRFQLIICQQTVVFFLSILFELFGGSSKHKQNMLIQ